MHDLVIRNGMIVDGTGKARYHGDIAVDGSTITKMGKNIGRGKQEVDAKGKLVTPGWVDVHTHYDGQVTWDPYLSPSGWHGVTTVVMGNCGVGFAPAKPDKHDWLIGLMEGVEDIPGSALSEGIQWGWESFSEYMDFLDDRPLALDVGTQIPHCSLRTYVMGERGSDDTPPTPEDLEKMCEIVREGLEAGALGFTTSRTINHRTKSGDLVPGHFANDEELLTLGRELGKWGSGVFEMASDVGLGYSDEAPYDKELDWMSMLSKETGLPITYTLLEFPPNPHQWRDLLKRTAQAVEEGANIKAQVAARPVGLLFGWETTLHPFLKHPTYMKYKNLPLKERLEHLRKPEIRAKIIDESTRFKDKFRSDIVSRYDRMFGLGNPPNYEPTPEQSIAALAEREGKKPSEVVYDIMMQDKGTALLYRPLSNYENFDFEAIREMLLDPHSFLSLSDGGAHCGVICDASMPTFNLVHWVRDRDRGERFTLEQMVHMQTQETAQIYGLMDRGVLQPGMKADVNIIDFDGLSLAPPEMVHDLPAESRRLIQRVEGYQYTIVSGVITYENGIATGNFPGKLIRGVQSAPSEQTL